MFDQDCDLTAASINLAPRCFTHLSVYFFDRKSKMKYLTEEAVLKVNETVCNQGYLLGYPKQANQLQLSQEFKQFCRNQSHNSRSTSQSESAREWWLQMPEFVLLKANGLVMLDVTW